MKLKHFFSYANHLRKLYQGAWASTLIYGDTKSYIQNEKESLKEAYVELEKEEKFLKILSSKTITEENIIKLVDLKMKDLPRKETSILFDHLIKEEKYQHVEKLLENYPEVLYVNMVRLIMKGIKEEQVPAFKFLINLREKIDDIDYTHFSMLLIQNKVPKELLIQSITYLAEKNVDNNELKYDAQFLEEMRQEMYIKLNGQWEGMPKRNSVHEFFKELEAFSEKSPSNQMYANAIRTEVVDKILATKEKNYLEEKIANFRKKTNSNQESDTRKNKKI